MNEEEFEELFGNTPFENIKKIRQYIDKNYIPIKKVKDKIEELKGTEELLSDEQGYWGGSDLLAKIEVLQDLLERSREDEFKRFN